MIEKVIAEASVQQRQGHLSDYKTAFASLISSGRAKISTTSSCGLRAGQNKTHKTKFITAEAVETNKEGCTCPEQSQQCEMNDPFKKENDCWAKNQLIAGLNYLSIKKISRSIVEKERGKSELRNSTFMDTNIIWGKKEKGTNYTKRQITQYLHPQFPPSQHALLHQ